MRHGNVMGTLHGGALATLADTAMGFAFATTLAADESFATLEMKVSFPQSRVDVEAHGSARPSCIAAGRRVSSNVV